jgi:hypothetical protein
MSTNATITLKNDDGSYDSIYVHYDGYLEHVGSVLKEHYNTLDKVKALIALGDLSSLDISTEMPENHTWIIPIKGHCIPYSLRDEDRPTIRYDNDVVMKNDCNLQYNYLFEDGVWKYKMRSERPIAAEFIEF